MGNGRCGDFFKKSVQSDSQKSQSSSGGLKHRALSLLQKSNVHAVSAIISWLVD